MAMGRVVLVGAGPGDPGLLTDKGRRALSHADVIVYDRLASPRLLAYAKPNAKLVYVGKASNAHTVPQAEIEETIISLAKRGMNVVRLKGGDPFVFGRGGEEAQRLTENGVPWEVIPGVTSAVAVPAYAGIPVTYRNVSPSFTVVTGHRCADGGVDWHAHAKSSGTLVILMGVSQLPDIVEGLIGAGKSSKTPIALVRWGTRSAQQTLVGTLADIVATVRAARFESPAVIVVGDVVTQRASLAWYEQLPLQGRRIFITAGTTAEALDMAEAAETLGAETHVLSLEHVSQVDERANDNVLASLQASKSKSGVYFRTSYGVKLFFTQMRTQRMDIRKFASVTFGASDVSVSNALSIYGIDADVVGPHMPCTGDVASWWCEQLGRSEPGVADDWVLTNSLRTRNVTFVRFFQPYQMRPSIVDSTGGTETWLDIAKAWIQDGADAVWSNGWADWIWQALPQLAAEKLTTMPSHAPADDDWTSRVFEELEPLFWPGQPEQIVEAL